MDAAMCGRVVAAAVLSLSFPLHATEAPLPAPAFVELGHSIDSFSRAAAGRFARVDVDADGVKDLVFTADASDTALFVVGRKADGTIGFKQSDVISDESDIIRVLSREAGGTPRVLLVSRSGTVSEYSGWPLKRDRTFPVIAAAVAAVVGDVDADGFDDLLVLTSSSLVAYRLDSGEQTWSTSVQWGRDVALAQLDADPALEIILAEGAPARVLDGATLAVEWSYIDGFGERLAIGHFAPGGGQQWVAAREWQYYTVFRASPWSPLWGYATSHDIGAIATADLDGDGRDEILYGDGQWGSVHVIDSTTQLERFAIQNDGHGVSAVVAADIDGDGVQEIMFSPWTAYAGDPLVTVANGVDGATEWSYVGSVGGGFIANGIADVDGNGSLDVVAASGDGYSNGTIGIFDLISGASIWRSPTHIGNANDPFYMTARKIAFRDRPQLPGKDIVLAGTSTYSGRIIVVDGVTRETTLQIGFYASGPMRSRAIKGLALFDYDGDGVEDFVVATEPLSTGANGALLQVFSGTDGAALWTSVTMGSGFARINDVIIADSAEGKPGKELVAVLPGSLRAYNSVTGLLSWTLAVENVGAAYLPHGVAGAELAVLGTDKVGFYDAHTRQFLREMLLPSPVRAIAAPGGDAACLVVALADRLAYLDGVEGTLLAETPVLGTFPEIGSVVSSTGDACASAMLATGTQSAFYRFRMIARDRIFADSFEVH